MPEEVKFTEEELKQVQDIQQSYANVQNQFGQLKLAQIRLDEQEVELEESFKSIQDDEKKFLRSEDHTSELQSPYNLLYRLLLEK